MKAGILIGHMTNKGNEGAILRTAEAFGINHVFVIGTRESKYKTAEGTDRHMTFFEFKDIREFLTYVAKNNHKLVCIENLNEAKNLSEIEQYPVNPIFIVGNESMGVPELLLKNASVIVKIKQGRGYGNCLNTAIANSIIIYDFFNKESNRKTKYWETSPSRRK